ncbi:hypothetical protein ACJX0J_022939, partial [Zea mays]
MYTTIYDMMILLLITAVAAGLLFFQIITGVRGMMMITPVTEEKYHSVLESYRSAAIKLTPNLDAYIRFLALFFCNLKFTYNFFFVIAAPAMYKKKTRYPSWHAIMTKKPSILHDRPVPQAIFLDE